MRKRKTKGDNLQFVIALLIFLPFFVVNNIGVVFIAFIICVASFFIYWFITRNKRKEDHLNARASIIRRPIVNAQPKKAITPDNRSPVSNTLEWSRELISSLEWKQFEVLCAEYFKEKGYITEVTKQGADGGIDVLLFKESYSTTKPFGIVQCKAWNSYRVGVKPVRELYGVMAAEKAPLAIFMTSGSYTKEAVEFSAGKHLKLLSGHSLLQLIQALPEDNQNTLLRKITAGDYTTPSCPSCGVKMTKRTSKKGKNIGNNFWGCINYPKCRNTLRFKAS